LNYITKKVQLLTGVDAMTPPKKILFATDLSARSDRAQDRAVMLMKEYNAELIVLHVIEPVKEFHVIRRGRFSPSYKFNTKNIESAKKYLREDLAKLGERVKIRIETGHPADVIPAIAEKENCDLIVTGVARNEMLGRFTLGKTVDRLLKRSEIPLLIVTGKVRTEYKNIVITTDFSETSARALRAALSIFPEQNVALLNSFAAPGSYAVEDAGSYIQHMREIVFQECTEFISRTVLNDELRSRISIMIEWGDLSRLLNNLASSSSTDLVVIGSEIRGVLLDLFTTSATERIVSALPCDALIIRNKK
jgi:nucleotide-binding universal stress UspA family protein